MISRAHDTGTCRSVALYSTCEFYRYRLTRRWGPGQVLAVIMLNPSTADERRNDPTIARCESRARALEYDGVDIVNLFAFRATRPSDLKTARDPEGPGNPAILRQASVEAGCIVAAWGVHGGFRGQGERVRALLGDLSLFALGETRDGHPRHPLYVRNSASLSPWPAQGVDAGAIRAETRP